MRFRTATKLGLVGVLRERCSLVELRDFYQTLDFTN